MGKYNLCSNILYICSQIAEQYLKAKMKNGPNYITFPYPQSTSIPNFVFQDLFVHSLNMEIAELRRDLM
jgi:hypothetical protein